MFIWVNPERRGRGEQQRTKGIETGKNEFCVNAYCVKWSIYPLCCAVLSRSVVSLCNPVDCSLPGSSVHGNSSARILEWVAYPFSRGSS